MLYKQIRRLLSYHRQLHLLEGLDVLSLKEQQEKLEEIRRLPWDILSKQKALLALTAEQKNVSELSYWNQYTVSPNEEAIKRGEEILFKGNVACFILAGGLGSRLGSNVPKGMTAVSSVKKKTLFQIFCEKTFYAGKKYGKLFPLVIMTSPCNHEETRKFLSEHRWFGLEEDQVYYVMQEELPFCDEQGDWFLEAPGVVALGPDGNGRCLHHLYSSGLWEKLRQEGKEYLTVVPVDNPLADPFDAELIGLQSLQNAEIGVKSVMQESAQEKVGALMSERGHLRIIEYSEKKERQDAKFFLANTGLFSFSFPFIESLIRESKQMPWHLAHKRIRKWPQLKEEGFWKFEYFLFDVFDYAKKTTVLLATRDLCFSPLKNASGEKSVEMVARDLLEFDRKRYRALTGTEPPLGVFELSFALHYPRKESLLAWKKIKWPQVDYIEPSLLGEVLEC